MPETSTLHGEHLIWILMFSSISICQILQVPFVYLSGMFRYHLFVQPDAFEIMEEK